MIYDVPNLPDDDAPDGVDESGNVVITTCDYDYFHCEVDKPLPHWDVAKKLDILDIGLVIKLQSIPRFFEYKTPL